MVRIRVCEESFVEPILTKTIKCPVHLYSGEEAIATGVCAHLGRDDVAFGTHRSHGHFLAKGGSLRSLIAEVYCRESGCSKGRGGSMHVIDPENNFCGAAPIVGGTISLAVGAGLAASIRENNSVSVAFFGDGAAGQGVLYESMNLASIWQLPVIFVCENNYYSTHMPLKEIRSRDSIYETAPPFDMLVDHGDGNDVLGVYEMTKRAVAHCRSGKGPAFMEFSTYRLRGHVGPDDNIQGSHTDIRPPTEISEWRKRDPIVRFRRYLLDEQILDSREIHDIEESATQEVRDAHMWAESSDSPQARDLGKYVFK